MLKQNCKHILYKIVSNWALYVVFIISLFASFVAHNSKLCDEMRGARLAALPKIDSYISKYCPTTKILALKDQYDTISNQTIYVCFNGTREYEFASIANSYLPKKFKLSKGETIERE